MKLQLESIPKVVGGQPVVAFPHSDFLLVIGQALVAPASLIARNAGVEGEVVVEKIMENEWEFGYNAMNDKYENLVEAGVIDPAKVTRCALQNAASVAGMVLTTQAIVVEKKPKQKASVARPAPGTLTV